MRVCANGIRIGHNSGMWKLHSAKFKLQPTVWFVFIGGRRRWCRRWRRSSWPPSGLRCKSSGSRWWCSWWRKSGQSRGSSTPEAPSLPLPHQTLKVSPMELLSSRKSVQWVTQDNLGKKQQDLKVMLHLCWRDAFSQLGKISTFFLGILCTQSHVTDTRKMCKRDLTCNLYISWQFTHDSCDEDQNGKPS